MILFYCTFLLNKVIDYEDDEKINNGNAWDSCS